LLDNTKIFLNRDIDLSKPFDELIEVLNSAIELLSLPENDFCWSSWEDKDTALSEIYSLINQIRAGDTPQRLDVSVLFAPTGPIQEVSISSGWGDIFLILAEKYDEIERRIWKQ
jgi:hypothetical protein